MSSRILLAAALALSAAACSGPAQTTVTTLPPAVSGKIVGFVTDAATGKGVSGATVSVLAGDKLTATTGPDGSFVLSGVPGGGHYRVSASLDGYVGRFAAVELAATTSNPVASAPLVIARADASLTGTVHVPGGGAAGSAHVGIDLTGDGWAFAGTATVGTDGKFTLTGLPGLVAGLAATATVAPFDANGDGTPEFPATARAVSLYPSAATRLDVTLGTDVPAGGRPGITGRITGFAVDAETGAFVDGLTVETVDLGVPKRTVTSGGYFVLSDLTAGATFRVTLSKDGVLTRFFDATLPQPPTDVNDAIPVANLGVVTLAKPNASISGRVENASGGGMPIAGATVTLDLTGSNYLLSLTATTGADGKFKFQGLPGFPRGFTANICVYTPDADGDGYSDFSPTCPNVSVFPNQASPAVIRLSRNDLAVGDMAAVTGIVRDNYTRLPLAGVQVYELGEDAAQGTVTDAKGQYFLTRVTAPTQTGIIFHKDGYAEAYLEQTTTRGQTFGSSPSLVPNTGAIDGEVLYQSFLPAANAEVRIDLRSSGWNYFTTVRTDGLGKFKLEGLPASVDGFSVQVTVSPFSADANAFPEASGTSATAMTFPGARTPLSIVLNTRPVSFQVVAYNVASGIIAPTDPIRIAVNLDAVPAESSFSLTDNTTGISVQLAYAWDANNRMVTLTPYNQADGTWSWIDGRSYTLNASFRAVNRATANLNNVSFLVRSTGSVYGNIANQVRNLQIIDPKSIDYTSHTISRLTWDALPDAWSYRIYARQSGPLARFPDFALVANVAAQVAPATSFTFNSNWDVATGSMLAFGTRVTLQVVPLDSRGFEAAPDKAATIEFRDDTPPRFLGGSQLDAAPAAAPAKDVRFALRFSEPLDRLSAPTIVATGYTVKSWTVSDDGLEGTLTLTGSGGGTLKVSGAKDTSGNAATTAISLPILNTLPIANGSFEGPGCSLASWTAGVVSTSCNAPQPAPAAVPRSGGDIPAREGTCSLQLGDQNAYFSGRAPISTLVDLTNAGFLGRPLSLQVSFFTAYGQGGQAIACEVGDATANPTSPPLIGYLFNGALTNYTQRQWQTATFDASSYTGKTLRVNCWLDNQGQCGSRGALFVDDLRVYVK